jgi:hypothetical protein
MAGEYEIKGPSDAVANLTSQGNPLCGKVGAFASCFAFLGEGMASDLNGAHGFSAA